MTSELVLYQSMWAMEDLPWRGVPWTTEQQLEQIAAAGYAGVGIDLGARRAPAATVVGPLIAEHGLRSCVLVFASTDEDMRRAIDYAGVIGADWIICCARIFGFDTVGLSRTIARWHAMCADAGIEMELETHRDTVTNDLRFTVQLLDELDPSIELAADLSHYVCAHEIPETPDEEYESLIAAVLERSGSLQGRVATRAQIQVPLGHPMAQPWEHRFRQWWAAGFSSIRRRHPDGQVRFVTELGTAPYAITDAAGVQISDRWAEAATLRHWATEAFDQTGGVQPVMQTVEYTTTSTGNRVACGPLSTGGPARALLPTRAYTSAADYDLERERIFASGWVWAGYAHWVAEPGQVKPVTVAGRPLLMVRGEDDEVRVFHNSCRHRGMALTEEPIRVTRRIQCAYHCWSYELDGRLAATPYLERERGRSSPRARNELGLLPVASRVWAGMVFVDLGEDDIAAAAETFDRFIEPLANRWSHIDFDRLHLAEERVFDIGANWKLVVENFLDFYHLPFIHPQVGPVSVSLDVDDEVLAPDIFGGSYPRGASGKAAKTADALPFLGDVPVEATERQDIFCAFPNALLFLEADWFQVIGLDATGPERTVEHMAIFVDQRAASEDHSANRKALADTLFGVNEQDLPILAKMQAGRYSPGADRTNLVPHWDQVTAIFQQLVAARVG